MIKKIHVLMGILFCVILADCQGSGSVASFYSKHETIAYKVTNQVAQSLSQTYNLAPFGSGGMMHEDVEEMGLSLRCFRKIDLNQARELIVKCAQEYLETINNNSELKPYLHNYPFTASNIELSIYISKPDGGKVDVGEVCTIYVLKNKVTYEMWGEDSGLKTLHRETFDEAVELVSKGGGK